MDSSIESKRQSSGEYLRLKVSVWVLAAAFLYLAIALVFETTRFPPIIILVIMALCGWLILGNSARLRALDFEHEEWRTEANARTSAPWVPDYRFSDETQRKVQNALNWGAFSSLRKDQGGPMNPLGTEGQRLDGDPRRYDSGPNYSPAGFQSSLPGDLVRTPQASKDFRKVYLDNVPNGWTTIVKQEDRFSPFVGEGSHLRFSGGRPSEDPYRSRGGISEFGPDIPLSLRQDPNPRRSFANPLHSKLKTSIASRQEVFDATGRLEAQAQEAEVEQEALFREFGVDVYEFGLWAQHNLATWLARSVIPDLILRNFANLKSINSALNLFRLELAEFHCLSGFAEEDWNNERFAFERRKSGKKFFDVDQFLRCHAGDFADFKKLAPAASNRLLNFQQTLDSMKTLAQERVALDLYFGDPGEVRNEVRLAKLRRLYQIKDEGFRRIHEGNGDGIADEDFMLDLIVQTIREHDGFYKSHRSFRRNFVSPLLRSMEVDPDDFCVEKGPRTLLLILSKRKTKFLFDLEGVFKLGVFLIHFVQDKHRAFLRGAPQSPLSEVVKNMDIRKRMG